MKKLFAIILLLCCFQFSFAAFSPTKSNNSQAASANNNAVIQQQQRAALEQFSKMSVKDYEAATGRKMNFFQRIEFKFMQHRVKQQLHRDEGLFSDFDAGGFFLGLLLGLIGVLIAYIFGKDSNMIKWSWIGCGIAVILFLLLVL